MSDHKKPMSAKLLKALEDHRLPTDSPSQLADAFRHGWKAAVESAADIVENADTPDCGGWTTGNISEDIRKL